MGLNKTWKAAQDYCIEMNGSLSTITTADENVILHNVIKEVAKFSWIGLHQVKQSTENIEEDWHWSDGDMASYRNWLSGEPNEYAEYCAVIRGDNGKWNNVDCKSSVPFFCHKWPQIVLVQETMSWEEALLHCRREHTDLARMLTNNETAMADAIAKEAGSTRVWTSLRFLAGEWLWVSEGNEGNQRFTEDSLPDCPAQRHSCGARRPSDRQWENRDCQEKLKFFCYRA